MASFCNFRTWLLASLVWTAAMAAVCYATWPVVPLDISPTDPATIEALRGALLRHALFYGALAAVPPLLALLAGRSLCARS